MTDLTFSMPEGYRDFTLQADVGYIRYYESDPVHNTILATASRYITTDDPLVKDVYDHLLQWMVGCTDTEKAVYLQSFVNKNIGYLSDEEHQGVPDYIQYPAQTLYYGKGDCEDTAILLYTLYRMAGLDATLIQMPEHISVGVVCDHPGRTVTSILTGKEYIMADPKTDIFGESPTGDIAIAFATALTLPIFTFMTLVLAIVAVAVFTELMGEHMDRRFDNNGR